MTDNSMPPWDNEFSEWLEAEREIPKAPEGLQEVVAARLVMTGQVLGLTDGLGEIQSVQPGPASVGATRFLSHTWVKMALTAAVVFPSGVWVGQRMDARTTKPHVEVSTDTSTIVSNVPTLAPTPTAAPRAPLKVKEKITPQTDDLLAEERALLEMARTAILSNRLPEASTAIKQHETKFAMGRLREERESLKIQWLLSSGNVDAARKAVEEFSKQFPESMLLPALKEALP